MFWAVTCESGKKYSQKAKEAFRIRVAALEPKDKLPENTQVSLMVEHGGKEFLLCTLDYNHTMQCNLDLKFGEGEEPTFFVSGEGTIHLSGFHLGPEAAVQKDMDNYQPGTSGVHKMNINKDESDLKAEGAESSDDEAEEEIGVDMLLTHMDDSDNEDDSDYDPLADKMKDKDVVCLNSGDIEDDEEEDSDILDDEKEDYEDDDDDDDDDVVDDDDDDDDEDEEEEIAAAGSSKKRKKNVGVLNMKRPKREAAKNSLVSVSGVRKQSVDKAEEDEDDSESEDEGEVMDSSIGHTPMPKKVVGILKNGSQSTSKSFASPSLKSGPSDKGKQPLIKKDIPLASEKYAHSLPSGVMYEDLRVGCGPMAKNGRLLNVYYVGKLEDGKIFDSTKEGRDKPFALRLGKSEVISGWDEGLVGMRVGGKRKLKIPPKMAYGHKKMPGIPPNSTLYFTVELKAAS